MSKPAKTANTKPTSNSRRTIALSGDGSNLSSRISYTAHEREGVHTQKVRLAKMAKRGADWDGTAANDNIAWPLATALIKEGNADLLKYAMVYRKIYDAAKSEAMLGGTTVALGEGVSLDQRQWIKPSGEIAYKGVRVVSKETKETPAKRKTSTDSEKPDSGYSNVPKIWNGDRPVNDMIDAQQKLHNLQRRLGHLCEPFELACIDGKTLAEVGNAFGVANRSGAQGAGRALVHTALVTLRDCIGEVRRQDIAA